ncbi:RNAse3 domain-containing protein [Rutstroemia sp. NJR-2017a BBW]|nr:RNAse3 domain-containing protein [Rutstroemia sp. NJR-2017a BBW]
MASSGGLDDKSKPFVNSAGGSPVDQSDLDHDSRTVQNEVVVDLTGEDDEMSSDHSSLPSKTGELADEAIEAKIVTARTYQLEMLAESMKGNAIVTSCTQDSSRARADGLGQGTAIMILPPSLIWLLAPTKLLAAQHYDYLTLHIPSVVIRYLSGDDGVDRWTEQRQWDAILNDVKIVVSTYQILLDALTHGFVGTWRYDHELFLSSKQINIDGTSYSRTHSKSCDEVGSPVVCRTPKIHRADLRLAVKLPVLSIAKYDDESQREITSTMASLRKAWQSLDIRTDPYILELENANTERAKRELKKLLLNHKTQCQKQMKSLCETSDRMHKELGPWAVDHYISEVISNYMKKSSAVDYIEDLTATEKVYLSNVLRKVEVSQTPLTDRSAITNKVRKLLELISQQPQSFSAITFVTERAMVRVLASLLSRHPATKELLKLGTMVGTSVASQRPENIGNLINLDEQKHTLSHFRNGKINFVVATSVLEEGIDVPACNLVICFSKPANLKSFIQRRGRARQQDSKLVLLDPESDNITDWHQLETNMRRMYEDDMRALRRLVELEAAEERSDEDRILFIESTGARLSLHNSMSHLYHFCATLPSKEFGNTTPDFIFSSEPGSEYVRAKVVLPPSVSEKVRVHESRGIWLSEKQAAKDAAFEAYVALYNAGLINDNLLPLMVHDELIDELTSKPVDTRASLVTVKERINPWLEVARAWMEEDGGHHIPSTSVIALEGLEMAFRLPITLPFIPPLKLHWDTNTEFVASFSDNVGAEFDVFSRASEENHLLLTAAFGHRFPIERRQMVAEFMAYRSSIPAQLQSRPVRPEMSQDSMGLIREIQQPSTFYIFKEWLNTKPPIDQVHHPYSDYLNHPEDVPHLALTRVTRRADFLHQDLRPETAQQTSKPFSYVLPASKCTEDNVPFELVRFGMFIPSITQHIEIQLLVDHLSRTILQPLNITNTDLIRTAITASSSGDADYQRLEFLGDSILKFCATIQLIDEHPLWHEGYLSAGKDRLVSNSRLSRAAVEKGLDEYIITKRFTGLKWRPMYIDDILESHSSNPTPTRQMSSKILADVVEALIGVSTLSGGLPLALQCLQLFLPEITWHPLSTRRLSLYNRAPSHPPSLSIHLQPVESLLAYHFHKPALLIEALTHSSYTLASTTQSLERLEFLGDAVLDHVIVQLMWSSVPELSHHQMHLIRTALVNADFLAFLCMELVYESEIVDLTPSPQTRIIRRPLPFFLQHSSPPISQLLRVQTDASPSNPYQVLRTQIHDALKHAPRYPWALLARLQARKFYSDMVESILGAVWIDSEGSMDLCKGVLERMGVWRYAERVLRREVNVWHPKEEIGVLAGNETVKYVVGRVGGEGSNGEGVDGGGVDDDELGAETQTLKAQYWCRLFVGDEEIVYINDGVGKEEVKTRAAEQAVRILTDRKEGDAAAAATDENNDDDTIRD